MRLSGGPRSQGIWDSTGTGTGWPLEGATRRAQATAVCAITTATQTTSILATLGGKDTVVVSNSRDNCGGNTSAALGAANLMTAGDDDSKSFASLETHGDERGVVGVLCSHGEHRQDLPVRPRPRPGPGTPFSSRDTG